MKKSEKGFTLVESLLVLSIFLIISSITAFSVKPQFESTLCDSFFTQFRADILNAQQYAISHQKEIIVNIVSGEHYYYVRDRYDLPLVINRDYSGKILISTTSSLPLYFKFLPDGNPSKFGSLQIQCGKKKFRMTFLLGMGRFYVIEE
jgi:competence protein ComGD